MMQLCAGDFFEWVKLLELTIHDYTVDPFTFTIHNIGESTAGHFIVMELVSGAMLHSLLGRERDTANLLDWFGQTAKAVTAAHAAGITGQPSFLAWMLMTIGQIGEGGAALEEAKRALELNPSSIWALTIHAWVWCMTGHDAAVSIAQVDRAMCLSPHDPAEYLFYDVGSAAHLNAGRYDSGLALARRLTALNPNYYWGYLWCATNAAGAGALDEAQKFIEEARTIQPEVSIALVRQSLGAMAPEVDLRLAGFLAQAGLGE